MKKYLLLIIGLSCFFVLSYAGSLSDIHDYGLYFNTHSANSGKHTSLILENEKTYTLSNELTIQFDLFIRNETLYGQIFTTRTGTNKHIYLTLALGDDGKRFPALVIDEEVYELASGMKLDEWLPVSITFLASDNTVSVSYDGYRKKISYPLESVKELQFVFGAYRDVVAEVAPMNLREIKVWNEGQLFRHWKLERHAKNICYDELHQIPAISEDTEWLIDKHVEWIPVFSFQTEDLLGTTFDPHSGRFYLIASNNILVYDPVKNQKEYLPVKGGYVAMEYMGHFTFDPLGNQLVSYALNSRKVSTYSFDTNMWTLRTKNTEEPAFISHALAYSEADSSFYMIGGYGFYRFNNEIFKVKPSAGTVERVDYKPLLLPCVFASAGVIGNTLYVFGGRGNESGKQEVLAHNYYDLYAIDLTTNKSRKLWTVKPDEENRMLLSPSMYYVPADSAFYLWGVSNEGRMMKLSLKDSTYTAVSRPMEPKTYASELELNVYQNLSSERMYAFLHEKQKNNQHEVTICEISLPLMTEDEIAQTIPNPESTQGTMMKWVLGIGLVCLLGVGVLIAFKVRKRKWKSVYKERKSVLMESVVLRMAEDSTPVKEEKPVEVSVVQQPEVEKYFDCGKSSVLLLGTFCVKDKKGNNITTSFTPRLKSLLILLILYSQKEKNGILLKKLDELLWSDKEEEAARNNRNVSLRKLRVLLAELGGVEIIHDNGFVRIAFSEHIFCDYQVVCILIDEYTRSQEPKEDVFVAKLLELLSYGPLLSNTLFDWLDNFKATYSIWVLDVLNELLGVARQKGDIDLSSRIIDTMFLHDPLNEEALAAKCVLLATSGKKRLAKSVYDEFNKAYRDFLGENYKIPFDDLCK
jgi:DNA-binding SARP family transcriptional activator